MAGFGRGVLGYEMWKLGGGGSRKSGGTNIALLSVIICNINMAG